MFQTDDNLTREQSLRKRYKGHFISKPDWVFTSKFSEIRYRQTHLTKDEQLFRILLIASIFLFPFFIFFDHLVTKGDGWLFFLIVLRVAFVLMCIVFFVIVNKIKRFDHLQNFIVAWAIAIFSFMLLSQFSYKADFQLYALFDVLLITFFYISGLLPVRKQLFLGSIYIVAVFIQVFTIKQLDTQSVIVFVLAYLLATTVGLIISTRVHFYQRSVYRMHRDVKFKAHQLHKFAYRDALTGIYNRRAFNEHFLQYQKSSIRADKDAKGVYIVLADLDHFKQVNDTYGHDVGDQVLVAFAKLVNSVIRPTDGFYRFGGEEFIIVLTGCRDSESKECIDRIIDKLNHQGLSVSEINAPITSSFGMVKLGASDGPEVSLANADKALYEAKENGRNQLVVASAN